MGLNILQLRQKQLDLPFEFFRNMHIPEDTSKVLVTEHEGRYFIVPTYLVIQGHEEIIFLYNTLLQMAKAKGFTHLMLIYV